MPNDPDKIDWDQVPRIAPVDRAIEDVRQGE